MSEPRRGMGIFFLVWIGQFVSTLGSGLIAFGLGVTMLQDTGSVSRYTLIGLSSFLPNLLLTPYAGVLADRLDRRKILILSSLGAAFFNVFLFWMVRQEPIPLWLIYPVVMATAACGAFVWPTFSAVTTLLVEKEHLGRASGLVQIGSSVSSVIAPSLAALLLLWVELPGLVLLNLVSYLVPPAVLLLLRFPQPVASEEGKKAAAGGGGMGYGWHFIRERPGLLHLLLVFAGIGFCISLVQILLTPLVLSFGSPLILGLVLSVSSAGTLVGGIVMAVWGGPKRRVPTIIAMLSVTGLLLILIGLDANASLVASAAFFCVLGFPVIAACSQVIWQTKVPADVQGRVFAFRRLIAGSTTPLALILAGPLSDQVFEPALAPGGFLAGSVGRWIGVGPGRGIAFLFMLLGLGILGIVAAALRSRSLRRLEDELPDAEIRAEGEDPAAEQPAVTRPQAARRPLTVWVALLLLLLAGALASLHWQRPPKALGPEVPARDFSAARAMGHVRAIAQRPHPTGSVAQAEVRDYLLAELDALGLDSEVQRALSSAREGRKVQAVRVENVLGRLRGTSGAGRAVLLVAHYDSVPTSPGASDNGAAVGTLLETARALAAGPKPAHDVMFLFSDAEEIGLHGARAFLRQHPWAREAAVVLNFDARGHGGPVYMFQTSERNGQWIPTFLRAATHPVANSLMNQIYQRLPNQTDFTVFQEAGLHGFNFAFIEGLTHYHGALDREDEVEADSVQHQGSYALDLARGLDLGSPRAKAADRAYFNALGFHGVHYPRWFAAVSAILAGLGTLLLAGLALTRGRIRPLGLGQGFISILGLMLVISVAVTLVWLVLRDLLDIPILMGSTVGAGWFMAAFVALAVGIFSLGYSFFRRAVGSLEMGFGALLWWLILVAVTSEIWLPVESNVLFVWAVLGILPAFAWLTLAPLEALRGRWTPWVLGLFALPALFLQVPLIAAVYIAMQGFFQLGGVPLVLLSLLLALLIPQMEILTRGRAFWLPALAVAVALTCLVVAMGAGGTEELEGESFVLYTLDSDAGEAHWYSFDRDRGSWHEELEIGRHGTGAFGEIYPMWGTRELPRSPAPVVPLPRPEARVLDDIQVGEERHLRLHLPTSEGARGRWLWLEPAEAVISARIDGREFSLRRSHLEEAPVVEQMPLAPEGEEIFLRLRGSGELTLTLVDHYSGLPSATPPRPADTQPRFLGGLLVSDSSLVRRELTLPALLQDSTELPIEAEGEASMDAAPTGDPGLPR